MPTLPGSEEKGNRWVSPAQSDAGLAGRPCGPASAPPDEMVRVHNLVEQNENLNY